MNSKISFMDILKSPKSIIGIIISFGAIYWCFKDFNFSEVYLLMFQINYIYVLFASILLWGSVWIRGLRWKLFFPKNNSPTTNSLYKAEMIGYFGNNVLPLRLGELLRSYIIGNEYSLSKSFVFGTIILERIMDFLCLGLFGLILVLFFPFETNFYNYIIFTIMIIFSIVFILVILLSRINLNVAKNNVMIILKNFIDGLSSIRREVILYAIFLSLIIWLIYLFDVYLLQKAFNFNLNWLQILAILVISSIAISIPSAPGMIGTFHAAIKFTMVDLFAYSISQGNLFAILTHAYGFIMLSCFGAFYFIKCHFNRDALKLVMQSNNDN